MFGGMPQTSGGVPEAAAADDRRLALVIDDEILVLQGLSMALRHLGWDVAAATSAAEALAGLDAADRMPDVIVADFRLRAGRTGVEAINLLHQHLKHRIPAVLLTGDTGPDRLREARLSGFPVLHKPVTLRELAAALPARGTLQPA